MKRRIAGLGVAIGALLVASACSSGHHITAPTTTTTTGPNPDAVPAVITPAYVDAVFKVLNHINGNAVRTLVAGRAVTAIVTTDLRAIYNDPLFEQEEQIARQSLSVNPSAIRNPPGDRDIEVLRLISASPDCIFVSTTTSLAAVLVSPPAPLASEYYGLRLKQPGGDPSTLNSTPWAIAFNASYLKPTTIPDQCAA